jgi:hypothetical protein
MSEHTCTTAAAAPALPPAQEGKGLYFQRDNFD